MAKKKNSVLKDSKATFEYEPTLSLPQICYAIIAVNDLKFNGKINSYLAHCIICNLASDLNKILDLIQNEFEKQLNKKNSDENIPF